MLQLLAVYELKQHHPQRELEMGKLEVYASVMETLDYNGLSPLENVPIYFSPHCLVLQ